MIAPQGQKIGPAGLELPAGARNRRIGSVKIRIKAKLKKSKFRFFKSLKSLRT